MIFNKHYNLEGKHAFLGASKYHWINYDKNKLIQSYFNFLAIEEGTELHELAAKMIRKRIKASRSKQTFYTYVNDAIGFKMTPEVVLYYSNNCFGTADAISFKNNFLRIHDLKTGSTPASMSQLMIYASLFCLEYDHDPEDIQIELRIYQNDKVQIYQPPAEQIRDLMNKIIESDKIINSILETEQDG